MFRKKDIYVLSYTLPPKGGIYVIEIKHFRRKNPYYYIWIFLLKIKYKTVETIIT